MALPRTIASPLTGREGTAELKRTIRPDWIISEYRRQFGYDAAPSFAGVQEFGLYECVQSGFRFFYPYSIAGEESLYRTLEQFPWNYKDDKWEYDRALRLIGPGQRVLDVGCGRGSFLRKCILSKAQVAGIELNGSAARAAAESGVGIASELIEAHAVKCPEHYDVVASFQVLEHIASVGDFIRSCVRVLKPGGLLIYGVPNNDGFVSMDELAVLNGPPHHMGLWTRRSLEALPDLFPLDLRAIDVEPLQEVDWYQAVMERRYLPKRWQCSLFYRLGGAAVFRRFIQENAGTIAGHTILAVYQKRKLA